MAIYLEDSYSESNQDSFSNLATGGFNIKEGQSFTATNSKNLYSAKFYLKKNGTPTGSNVTATLYAHTGTFGTTGTPTGSALATSDAIDISTFSTSFTLVEFFFTGANQVALTAGTKYFIVVEYSGDISLQIGWDGSSPGHSGNPARYISSWAAITGDVCFYVYTTDASSASSSPSSSPSSSASSSPSPSSSVSSSASSSASSSPSPSSSSSNSPSTSPSAPADQVTDITYEIQIDTANTFDSQAGNPLLDKFSATDPGFADVTNSLDVDPFATDDQIAYTVQAGDALADGTYYWRVRGKDPLGSNTWGSWSETWVFTLGASVVKDVIQMGIIVYPR